MAVWAWPSKMHMTFTKKHAACALWPYTLQNPTHSKTINPVTLHTPPAPVAPQLFHMKIEEAAASLKLSLSTLKNSARDAGVKRWPQRKLSSLKGMHAAILADASVDGRKRQALFAQIEMNLEEIMRDPNCGIHPSLEELRQVGVNPTPFKPFNP